MAKWLGNEPLHSERRDIRVSGMPWAVGISRNDCKIRMMTITKFLADIMLILSMKTCVTFYEQSRSK